LPPTVVEKLEKAATQMTASEEFKTRLTDLGASPIENSSAQTFPLEIQEEIKTWAAWAKENKLTAK
jgi:tripartite-type tricarboxylate transporter receptor subunit TctC